MADQFLVAPKPPPALNIPGSKSTVKVSCIDTTGRFKLPIGAFLQPEYAGADTLAGPSFSFLIEHPSRKPILFDLGIRKDFDKLPAYPKFVEKKWKVDVPKDVATILQDRGVDVGGGVIDAIIWSHHHWDHTGDPSTFPSSTGLVVGPGFQQAHLPGYPEKEDATLLATDVEGRNVRELDFAKEGKGLKIGRFNALDYFGDGSFYLLDTPGHSIGHICGLARTSLGPDTFIFMGGDASHHGGEFRPTEYLPLPTEVAPSPLTRRSGICPGHLFRDVHPDEAADKPFYHVTKTFAYDKEVADWTIAGLGEFDAHENVLLLLAHDKSVIDPAQFRFYPDQLSDWHAEGIAAKVKWLFLKEFEGAVEAKEKDGTAFTWGER